MKSIIAFSFIVNSQAACFVVDSMLGNPTVFWRKPLGFYKPACPHGVRLMHMQSFNQRPAWFIAVSVTSKGLQICSVSLSLQSFFLFFFPRTGSLFSGWGSEQWRWDMRFFFAEHQKKVEETEDDDDVALAMNVCRIASLACGFEQDKDWQH